jgi:hypothetical protein
MDMDILTKRILDTMRYLIIGSNICCIHFDIEFKNIGEEKQKLINLQNEYVAILVE